MTDLQRNRFAAILALLPDEERECLLELIAQKCDEARVDGWDDSDEYSE